MRETLELRVEEQEAHRLFSPGEGVVLPSGGVRKVLLSLEDERLSRIAALQQEFRARGCFFFTGWDIHRRYSEKELRAAELLQLWPRATFEPSGEECGTQYDESAACAKCGAGARQVSELVLDLRRVPKGVDLARSIAEEVIVSARLVELCRSLGLTGVEFRPVRQVGKKGGVSSAWFQLVVTSAPVEVVAPTSAGINPFDLDERGRFRCPRGHVAGLNLLSELHAARASYDGSDLACTRQLFGSRQGVLRPRSALLVSPRLHSLLKAQGARKLDFEVVHLLGES